jgi:hypothetical protein
MLNEITVVFTHVFSGHKELRVSGRIIIQTEAPEQRNRWYGCTTEAHQRAPKAVDV